MNHQNRCINIELMLKPIQKSKKIYIGELINCALFKVNIEHHSSITLKVLVFNPPIDNEMETPINKTIR